MPKDLPMRRARCIEASPCQSEDENDTDAENGEQSAFKDYLRQQQCEAGVERSNRWKEIMRKERDLKFSMRELVFVKIKNTCYSLMLQF